MNQASLPALLSVSVLLTAAATSQQEGLSPIQVMKLRSVRWAHPTPDGGAAFVRSEPRLAGEAPGSSRSHLYHLLDGKERLLIGGQSSVRGLSWAPGIEQLTRLDQGPGDDSTQLWTVPTDGSKPERLSKIPMRILSYKWRPDGVGVAYTTVDAIPPDREDARAMGFKQHIVDEEFSHISPWWWKRATGELRRLTDGRTVFSYEWSPDGKRLAVGMAPRNLVDDHYMFTRLYIVDLDTGEATDLGHHPGKVGDYAWSPHGTSLAYVTSNDQNDPHAGNIYLRKLNSNKSKALTSGLRGMAHQLEWVTDEGGQEKLHATISRGVRSSLEEIDKTGKGKHRTVAQAPGLAFSSIFDLRADGACLAIASTAKHPPELVRLHGSSAERLTNSNPWLADVALGRQTTERFEARDGLEIEGLLMFPVGYKAGKRYPMVIVAHGGPESHYSEGWNTSYSRWGQLLCARGYFAWYPNYRASTGYGVAFAKADHGDPMGREFEDHLDAIEYFSGKGLIDTSRIGVGGGSYGGYTAAWAATRHSDHFAAAVSFVPFVDIRTKWYTSDIPWEFYYVHYQEKWPHEQPGFLEDRSPLTWAPHCRTPLLLLGGTNDTRVHPSQPFMLYRAVKFSTDTPVRYVRYPGEGHGNRLNVYQYDYARRTLRWFDHYLGKESQRSDSPPPFDLDYLAWRNTQKDR